MRVREVLPREIPTREVVTTTQTEANQVMDLIARGGVKLVRREALHWLRGETLSPRPNGCATEVGADQGGAVERRIGKILAGKICPGQVASEEFDSG